MRGTTRPLGIAGFALGLVLAGAAPAGEGASGIDRFFRVNESVATGAQPTLAQMPALKNEGFHTIVNLRESSEYDAAAEASAARDLGLVYVNLPVKAADPKPEQVETFLRVLSDAAVYPVFIHCGSGNRVGAFWMIRRVLVDGWTAECAETEALRIGLKSPNLRLFALEYIAAHRSKDRGPDRSCSDGS